MQNTAIACRVLRWSISKAFLSLMSGSLIVRAIAPCPSSWDSFIASIIFSMFVVREGSPSSFSNWRRFAFWWAKIETGLDWLEREVVITFCTIANTFIVVFVLILVVVDVVHTVSKEINFKLDFVVHLIEAGARQRCTLLHRRWCCFSQ